ncbi:MAG: TetR family transcriptional regulator [Candidatus Dormibacteraeota bacterium]|nr:TetR family transcriptional regulator [Candidatus Dormibacteraeota bacterium]
MVDAALELLAESGIDGLSMRALADRLGVKAASLYWHVRDKQQVLELLADALLGRVSVPSGASDWRDQVRAACAQLADLLADEATAGAVILAALPVIQRSGLTTQLTRVLADAGLPEAGAAAFALIVDVAATAGLAGPAVFEEHPAMTLAIDTGSWRVTVRAGTAGMVEPAASVGGGGAASVEVRDGRAIVRSRRGGNRGAVLLNPRCTWHVKLHGGTWNNVLDLTGLRVAGVELDSGAGNVSMTLPAPEGVVPIKVNSGLVGVALHRPLGTAAEAIVKSGSVKLRFDGQPMKATAMDMHWESPGGASARDRYEVTVHSGCVRVSLDSSAPASRPVRPQPAAGGDGVPAASWAPAVVEMMIDGISRRLQPAKS